jgi:hypothetical protein
MTYASKCTLVGLSLVLATGFVLADDLKGVDRFICSAAQVTVCADDGDCQTDVPWAWNIPQFIEFDLAGKLLSTTKASGENRQTPIGTLKKEEGWIFVQGIELGRAFSFAIEEETGMLTAAVVRRGMTVSVFGACTPTPAAR